MEPWAVCRRLVSPWLIPALSCPGVPESGLWVSVDSAKGSLCWCVCLAVQRGTIQERSVFSIGSEGRGILLGVPGVPQIFSQKVML